MATAKAAPTAEEHDDFLPIDEAAEDIGCGKRWLRDGINHHGFPHDRYGKRIWLSRQQRAQIRAWHRQAARFRSSKPKKQRRETAVA